MNQKVIVTIDTEGHDGSDPIKHLIFGETADGNYGIERIMDELDAAGVKALFFVDFAEAWDYGEEKVRSVVEIILRRGHDIGVHVHPDHMADKNRLFLWEYNRDEQYDIIRKCTGLYEKLVGRKPLSFRAGKYGANLDTLDILCELGYKYDFSAFYHQQWCGIVPSFTINTPCRYKSLMEFPVTMHTTCRIGSIKREDKIDIEGMTLGELRYGLMEIVDLKFPVIVTLFFHSFSLLKWREQPDAPVQNRRNVEKLRKALQYVNSHPDLMFITEADLKNVESMKNAMDSEIVWRSRFRGFCYTIVRAFIIAKYNKKARQLVAGVVFLVAMMIGLIIWAIL